MQIRNLILSTAAALALTASLAVAHEGGHGGPGMGEGMEILHSLNLTDAQKEQVHGIEKPPGRRRGRSCNRCARCTNSLPMRY